MKKINYFLLIAITLLSSTIELNAFTTSTKICNTVQKIDSHQPWLADPSEPLSSTLVIGAKTIELSTSNSSSADAIKNNLTVLYSICVALVLFNLVAQVKIIYQMIHLFLLFRRKDNFAGFNFQ